jgi:hypothetical protein
MSSHLMQPVPVVTDDDVTRLAQRDFAPAQAAEVLALLGTYGTEEWEREAPRVRVAILRLAAGDLDRLQQQLDYAKRDYRDVLLGAEYLVYAALTLRTPHPSPENAQQAIDADWSAYQEWLRR